MNSLISSIASIACSVFYFTMLDAPAAWLVAAGVLVLYAWIYTCEH